MENYKIDYKRINQLYTDPDQRMGVLDKAKKRVGKLSREEIKIWFHNWCDAYYKSKAYTRDHKYFEKWVREDINRQAKKKIENEPKYNTIKVTRSAYEKAKYASKRVIDLSRKEIELRFSSFADKSTGIINDFFIPYQVVDGVSCNPCLGKSSGIAARLRKKVVGLAHSHAYMNPFHSDIDIHTLDSMCERGDSEIMDFHNGDEEKNKRFNFKIKYFSSIVFNARMIDDSNIKPSVSIGYWMHKLETDKNGNGKRGWEYFSRDNEQGNIKLEIIEDRKEINKKLIDQEILERVFTNRSIADMHKDIKNIEASLETITPATYVPFIEQLSLYNQSNGKRFIYDSTLKKRIMEV